MSLSKKVVNEAGKCYTDVKKAVDLLERGIATIEVVGRAIEAFDELYRMLLQGYEQTKLETQAFNQLNTEPTLPVVVELSPIEKEQPLVVKEPEEEVQQPVECKEEQMEDSTDSTTEQGGECVVDIEPPRDRKLRRAIKDLADDKYDTSYTVPSSYLMGEDVGAVRKANTPEEEVRVEVVDLDYPVDDIEAEAIAVSSTLAKKIEVVTPLEVEVADTDQEKKIRLLGKQIKSLDKLLNIRFTKQELIEAMAKLETYVKGANANFDSKVVGDLSLAEMELMCSNTLEYMRKHHIKLTSGADADMGK